MGYISRRFFHMDLFFPIFPKVQFPILLTLHWLLLSICFGDFKEKEIQRKGTYFCLDFKENMVHKIGYSLYIHITGDYFCIEK